MSRAPRKERAALSYRGAHSRVEREKGKAAHYRCRDCKRPAHEWSYQGALSDCLWAETGKPGHVQVRPYSGDPADYVPRCRRCHRRFDRREVNARRVAERLVAAGQMTLDGLARAVLAVAA